MVCMQPQSSNSKNPNVGTQILVLKFLEILKQFNTCALENHNGMLRSQNEA